MPECAQCGDCCRSLAMPIPSRDSVHVTRAGIVVPLLPTFKPGEEQWLQTRGVRFPARQVALVSFDRPTLNPVNFRFIAGQLCVLIRSTCPLLKGNLCRLHGKLSKPKICQLFPANLPKLELRSLHPKCGYLDTASAPVEAGASTTELTPELMEHAFAN